MGTGKKSVIFESFIFIVFPFLISDAIIPQNFDWRNTVSLGFKLVTILAEGQLDGNIDLDRNDGSHFVIRFKLENNH